MAAAKCLEPCTSTSNSCPVNNLSFKPLDEALRCRICFEYYNNCMITKCSHNYCSICIRRYMTYKSQCPTCFQDAFEPELRNNRLIDEILRLYKKLIGFGNENTSCIFQISDAPRHNLSIQENSSDSQSTSTMYSQSSSSNEPSTPRVKIEIPDDKDTSISNVQKEIDFNEVACPVCYNTVLADRINTHLDNCLKQQNNDENNKRKVLPKLVYHLLTEKEIKMKLREQGLNVSGDRQSLIRRHKTFVTLYNANCDSLNPKPVTELVKNIELQELEERMNSLPKQTQVSKRSDQSLIERQHKFYIKKHQSQFNALIQDVQQRHFANIQVKQEKEDSFVESCTNEAVITQNNVISKVVKTEEPSLSEKSEDIVADPSSLDDFDVKKTAMNLHLKRKKETVSKIKNLESPKKK